MCRLQELIYLLLHPSFVQCGIIMSFLLLVANTFLRNTSILLLFKLLNYNFEY